MLEVDNTNEEMKQRLKALAGYLDSVSKDPNKEHLTFVYKDLLKAKKELEKSILSGNKDEFDYLKGRYDVLTEITDGLSIEFLYSLYQRMGTENN